jgi:hypothetical protein
LEKNTQPRQALLPRISIGRRSVTDPAEFTEILQQHVRVDWEIVAARILPGRGAENVSQRGVPEQSYQAIGQLGDCIFRGMVENQTVSLMAHKFAETWQSGHDRDRPCRHSFRNGDAKRLAFRGKAGVAENVNAGINLRKQAFIEARFQELAPIAKGGRE